MFEFQLFHAIIRIYEKQSSSRSRSVKTRKHVSFLFYYYTIPTEVFARAWQMYIGEQYNDKDINDYNSDEPQFAPLVEMKAEVMAYFEKVLG